MKMRQHRANILARIAANNRVNWFVAPIMAKAKVTGGINKRIRAIVDRSFPEFAK